MLSRYRYILAALLAIAVVLPFVLTSEEDRILERLERLRELSEVTAAEGGIQQVARAREISGFFTEQSRYDLTSAGYGIVEIPDRRTLSQLILKGRAALASLQLALHEPRVSIDGDSAEVDVRGSGRGSLLGHEGEFLDIHLIRIMLIKDEGDWLISGARHLRNERGQP
jgi:hypothetical protein